MAKSSVFWLFLSFLVVLASRSLTQASASNSRTIRSEDCSTMATVQEKLDCLIAIASQLKTTMEPIPAVPFEYWPGNTMCISCNFMLGLLIGGIEVVALYVLLNAIESVILNKKKKILPQVQQYELVPVYSFPMEAQPMEFVVPVNVKKSCSLEVIGIILSVIGWLYWFTIFIIFWNFVSYMMVTGLVLIAPGIVTGYFNTQPGAVRQSVISRRLKLAGWLLGFITLAMFPNISTIPSQITRHLNPTETVITPDDELVVQLNKKFFESPVSVNFTSLSFSDKMLAVDVFIYENINWKSDYSQYYMVGLLTTPHEVIASQSGDCQGQAVVTTSLLISMGFRAWAVETPFHWWTHAEDPNTGEEFNLNVHGHGGLQGNVLPQPIDLVYTRPPTECSNCQEMFKHNQHGTFFIAPPYQALAIALTGAHIYVRSGLSLGDVSPFLILEMGLGMGLIIALYASYFDGDISLKLFAKRLLVASILGVGPIFTLLSVWTTILYPIATIHLFMVTTFALTYVAGQSFNQVIKS